MAKRTLSNVIGVRANNILYVNDAEYEVIHLALQNYHSKSIERSKCGEAIFSILSKRTERILQDFANPISLKTESKEE